MDSYREVEVGEQGETRSTRARVAMIRVEKSVVVDRPAEDVFACVADQTNAPRWQRGLLDVRRTTDGPIGVGTRHAVVRTFMGRRLELSNEYTRYEPSRLIEFGFLGAMPGQAAYVVESKGADRARLTSRIEMRVPGLFRVAAPLMAAVLRRDVEANLGRLKELLEAETEGRSPSEVPA